MKRLLLLPFFTSVLLTGCATHRPPIVRARPVTVPGTTLSKDAMGSVRYAENVKMYPVGRYIDPNNPNIMHEGHPVYRVESTAKWNLHPNPPATLIPAGPILKIRDAAKTSLHSQAELTAELARQQAATAAVIQGSASLSQKLSGIAKSLKQTRQVAKENAHIEQELSATKSRLNLLEAEFRQPPKPTSSPAPATGTTSSSSDW